MPATTPTHHSGLTHKMRLCAPPPFYVIHLLKGEAPQGLEKVDPEGEKREASQERPSTRHVGVGLLCQQEIKLTVLRL